MLRGRDDECRAVRNLLDDVTNGGGALLIRGEPGSGRTVLVGYAHRHAQGCTVLAGSGLAEEAALPYAGLQRLVDPILDRVAALPDDQRQLLRRVLAGEGCPPTGNSHCPWRCSVCSAPPPGTARCSPPWTTSTGVTRRPRRCWPSWPVDCDTCRSLSCSPETSLRPSTGYRHTGSAR
ncbi:ATP-binding protein [Micromonospora sp. M12]